MAPMLRAREACCSIKFQSREWGQLWGRKINYINFTFNIIYLRVKYGGGTVRIIVIPYMAYNTHFTVIYMTIY